MVELQKEGLQFNPNLMLIRDADMPAIWYHRLKKAWAESVDNGTPFANPVPDTDAPVAQLGAAKRLFPAAAGMRGCPAPTPR